MLKVRFVAITSGLVWITLAFGWLYVASLIMPDNKVADLVVIGCRVHRTLRIPPGSPGTFRLRRKAGLHHETGRPPGFSVAVLPSS
jgi:hypothetical protein